MSYVRFYINEVNIMSICLSAGLHFIIFGGDIQVAQLYKNYVTYEKNRFFRRAEFEVHHKVLAIGAGET